MLLPGRAVGQWICVDRASGRIVWEKDVHRPNTIIGIADGVIVATEELPVGLMGSGRFHRYGISLEQGRLLWTSHPSGDCGEPEVKSYWYPDRYDHRGAEAAPRFMKDGRCYCCDGTVVDLLNGFEIGRVPVQEVKAWVPQWPSTLAEALYTGGFRGQDGVLIAPGRRLKLRQRPVSLHLTNIEGHEQWAFDLASTCYEIDHPNHYRFRLAGDFFYLVVSERLKTQQDQRPGHDPPVPRNFHFLTVELNAGKICQDIRIGDAEMMRCQIEDVDDGGLLLSGGEAVSTSMSGKDMWYFERFANTIPA